MSDPAPHAVLERLTELTAVRGPRTVTQRLDEVVRWLGADLRELDHALAAIGPGTDVVARSVRHLLSLRGKHVRPMCLVLASRFGRAPSGAVHELALAVELVHSATLLHDDVVDVAEQRRGQPPARVVYGNAASIFAGDWLLVAALRRIAATEIPGLLERILSAIDAMIASEALQLGRRGRIDGARADYFAIVEGKTSALFEWAMLAGARSARIGDAAEHALAHYGRHLGVAFQAIDDELDYGTGDAATGKDPLVDLREGKITYPLVVALERDPTLEHDLRRLLERSEHTRSELQAIANRVIDTGALVATRALARERVGLALDALEGAPAGAARDALVAIAHASLERAS